MSNDGVWVKVHPDDVGRAAPAAAKIKSATVMPDTTSQDGYAIYTFVTSGSITLEEPGLVEVLIVEAMIVVVVEG